MTDPMPQFEQKDVDDNKFMAALSYVSILVLIPLLTKKDSKFTQAHAKQGLVLFIASVVLAIIPALGWALEFLVIIVSLIGFINALTGKFWKVPGAYELGKKIKI